MAAVLGRIDEKILEPERVVRDRSLANADPVVQDGGLAKGGVAGGIPQHKGGPKARTDRTAGVRGQGLGVSFCGDQLSAIRRWMVGRCLLSTSFFCGRGPCVGGWDGPRNVL